MVQVPGFGSVAVVPETTQTPGVIDVKLTAKPEVADAVRVMVVPAASVGMVLNVMFCDAFVPDKLNVTGRLAPLVLAAAVRLPVAAAVAVTDASPFEPVVAVPLEKVTPVPEKLTTALATGLPFVSFTMTTSGFAKVDPYGVVCPEPETTVMLDAVPMMVSVKVALLAA